jgi:hypothetical protein
MNDGGKCKNRYIYIYIRINKLFMKYLITSTVFVEKTFFRTHSSKISIVISFL